MESLIITHKEFNKICHELRLVLMEGACYFCPVLTKPESDKSILVQIPNIIFHLSPVSGS